MRVEQVMTTPATTVNPGTGVGQAWIILKAGRFRHLPVVEQDRLVGMVSDRDLRAGLARARATPGPMGRVMLWADGVTDDGGLPIPPRAGGEAAPTVAAIMRRAVVATGPATPVEEASRLMVDRRVGALPVLDGGRLVGIVSESDLLRALTRMLEQSDRARAPLAR